MASWGSDGWATATTAAVLGLATTIIVLRFAAGSKVHPNEPTVLPSWIPFIGHLVGMAVYGGRYIKILGLSHPHEPIFTLPVPGSRIYVVTDPALAAAVQRNVRALSFSPLVPDVTRRVLGLDDETVTEIRRNIDPEPGEPRGFLADAHDVVYSALGPGQYLNSLSCEASQELCYQLAEFAATFDPVSRVAQELDLLQWTRHLVAVGSARYLYGPQNPIAENPELEAAFWAFDQGLGALLMGIFPSIIASGAYQGRERMVDAFMRYFEVGHIENAARISRDRAKLEEQYGMNNQMIARSALSFLFAGIVNTTTTTFWVVLRLFADKELLRIVRQEVIQTFEASEKQEGPGTLSIGILKNKCATLFAVFRESLRIGSENSSVRLVNEDILLADRYFLKKGAVVQIAGGVIHANKSIWGDDVEDFNPSRFLTQKAMSGGIHPAAFRGFGGGKTLCPGRHFATNEILLFTALIVHGFDITPLEGGEIQVPQKNDRVLPVHILEPPVSCRPKVLIKVRDEGNCLQGLRIVI